MKFPDHRGRATCGERIVPLEEFEALAAAHGRRLEPPEREAAVAEFLSTSADGVPLEGPFDKLIVFGGVYSNHYALRALIEDARRCDAEALYCLGDLGGFGPNPEKVWPLLERGEVRCIQGNYEESLAAGLEDCNCGYTDPRDNHFAALSYDYTSQHCSPEFKTWMGRLPKRRRLRVGGKELLLVHGSPRRINEFLFNSASPVPFLEQLLTQSGCDVLLCTHTGLHWHRRLPSGRQVANVGAIGRPANDGRTCVWYGLVQARAGDVDIELVPLHYKHASLAREMREEALPEEFVETILTGWWTTCLEILPAKERGLSRY